MMRDKRLAATVAATDGEATPRVEIVSDRRRRHGDAFVSEVLAACNVPGGTIREVADRYGICVSLIYRWRRMGRREVAGTSGDSTVRLFPIRIAASAPASSLPLATAAPPAARAGMIEIELADDVRVRVDGTVNSAALRRVMAVLRR
jgi:transposase